MFLDCAINNLYTIFVELGVVNFYFDVILLQLLLLYTVFLFFTTANVYYALIYLFLLIVYFGLVLSLLHMELFTGFLWVTELSVLFILLLLCFYLNSTGSSSINYRTYYIPLVLLVLLIVITPNSPESSMLFLFNYVDIWDDFYEAQDNTLMTDFFGLFVSYYVLNAPFTIAVFLLLFFCSIVSVTLNKTTKLLKKENIGTYLSMFNFFKTFTNFVFYRRQNLSKQNMRTSSTKVFKKK